MKAACAQIHPEFGATERNLGKIIGIIESETVDLLIFPELATSGYEFSGRSEVEELAIDIADSREIDRLSELAADTNTHIVLGIPERAGECLYNSCVLIEPTGRLTTYRKIHLFDREKERFNPANEAPPVIDTAVGRLGLMICFDWIFPETARMLALQGAQILVHPSNLVLSFCQQAMFARSVENRVFSMTCNRIGSENRVGRELTFTGASQILSPKGEPLCQASKDGEDTIIAEINPSDSDDKMITPLNHIHDDRRVDIYNSIIK